MQYNIVITQQDLVGASHSLLFGVAGLSSGSHEVVLTNDGSGLMGLDLDSVRDQPCSRLFPVLKL